MNILQTSLKYTNGGEYKLNIKFEADPNSKATTTEALTKVVVNLVDSMFEDDDNGQSN